VGVTLLEVRAVGASVARVLDRTAEHACSGDRLSLYTRLDVALAQESAATMWGTAWSTFSTGVVSYSIHWV
jgi:hypothetical protein